MRPLNRSLFPHPLVIFVSSLVADFLSGCGHQRMLSWLHYPSEWEIVDVRDSSSDVSEIAAVVKSHLYYRLTNETVSGA